MTQIGIMIEGQDGLNWARWQRILKTAEDFGFQCVFRSDHFTNASAPDKDSLELWVSLTYAASHTQRIEFGSLVCPTTFRHPAMTTRMAAAVDDLSGGRLILGMGAGWQEREHHNFGVPFYDVPTRFAMLTDALEITTRLFRSAEPVTYPGQHYALEGAVLLPRPQRPQGPPILIGGNGPVQTLPLVAKYADEWNAVYLNVDTYRERATILNDLLQHVARPANSVKRSLMVGTMFARNDADLKKRLDDLSRQTNTPQTVDSATSRGRLVGTTSMFADQIARYVEAGVERFMMQWLDQDDIDGLEMIARDVLPQFHKD